MIVSADWGLTPTETQVPSLIMERRPTKAIAESINLSSRTDDTHGENIRQKVGIKHKKAKLRSHLLSLWQYR